MPTITKTGGPSNARDGGPSPAVFASEPLDSAEAVQGRPAAEPVAVDVSDLDEVQVETEVEVAGEPDADVDYNALTLAELKALAAEREVAAYGSKAQIAERLREAEQER